VFGEWGGWVLALPASLVPGACPSQSPNLPHLVWHWGLRNRGIEEMGFGLWGSGFGVWGLGV